MRGAAARAIASARAAASARAIGAAAIAAPLLMLAGACHREPSFDERYASAQKALHSEAADIDSELAARESEAAAATAVTGETPPPTR